MWFNEARQEMKMKAFFLSGYQGLITAGPGLVKELQIEVLKVYSVEML